MNFGFVVRQLAKLLIVLILSLLAVAIWSLVHYLSIRETDPAGAASEWAALWALLYTTAGGLVVGAGVWIMGRGGSDEYLGRREALLLVGAGGFSYEEAANICGCAVGTIKSRVGRARAALNAMLADGSIPRRSTSDDAAHRAILEELDEVAAGNGIAARS